MRKVLVAVLAIVGALALLVAIVALLAALAAWSGKGSVASGTILTLGLGYAFSPRLEARLEVPVMVFFGSYGSAAAVAIPITAGILYRF